MGKSQAISYAKGYTDNGLASLKEVIDQKLYAAAQVGQNITPLPAIVTNSGTIGDINGKQTQCPVGEELLAA